MLITSFFNASLQGQFSYMNGITYRKVVSDVNDEEPVFYQITDILETPTEEMLFITRSLKTVCYNRHYHAFEVQLTSTLFCCV